MTEDEIRAFCVKPTPCQYETGEDPATRCPIFAFKEDAEECKDSLCCENGWRCDPDAAEASCVQCLGDSDCVRYGKQKRCDVNEHACVECLGNSDCADNDYCTGEHACFQCDKSKGMYVNEAGTGCRLCFAAKPYFVDGTCHECAENTDCPADTYCTKPGDVNFPNAPYTCQKCSQDGTVKRDKDAPYCACPTGTSSYCYSTGAGWASNCKAGGKWTCQAGCKKNSDCEAGFRCTCSGRTCDSLPGKVGQCELCPTETFRSKNGAECLGCTACQHVNDAQNACVDGCEDGSVCLPTSCTFSHKDNRCQSVLQSPACMKKPELISFVGLANGKRFFLPPPNVAYRMTHGAAAQFCESYGLHLASLQEACLKDFAYNSGNDCQNITGQAGGTSNREIEHDGQNYHLSQWHVDDMGSFWLDAIDNANCTALRVTFSCGNNHESYICGKYYPLCVE